MKSIIVRSLKGKAKYAIPIAAIFASLMLLVVLAPAEKQIAAYNPYSQPGGGGGGSEYYAYLVVSESGLSSEISSWTASSSYGDNSISESPGNSGGITVSNSVSAWSVTLSWGGVPGYSTPGSVSISVTGRTSGWTNYPYDETGTYSGSPLAPTLSSVSASPNPVDAGQTTTFSNNAYAEDVNGGTFHWSGLVTSSSSNPTYSGGSGGTESMYYSTDAGSTSTYSVTLTVNSDPTISASASTTTADAGQSVSFSSSPSGGTTPYSYTWYEEISGGSYSSFSSSQNPPYSFGSAGTYYVYVHLSDNAGYGVNSNTLTITVNSDPSVSASSNLNPADAGQTITFSSSVSGGSGGGSYTWYSGSTSDQIGTGSSYSTSFSAGTYSIFGVYVDSAGYSVTSNTITETVYSDPSVSISSSQNPTDVGKSITLTASASGGTGSYSYQWYEGGNAISGATASTYSPGSYSSSGTYEYYVQLTDGAGYSVNSNTIDETVNSDPTISASASTTTADVGYSITFSSSPSGGTSPYTYSWTIGGTQESTSQDFSYSFSSAGSYTVTVTVTDSIGETYSASVSVTINNNPSVSVTSSQNPTDAGNSVTFTASESGGTGTISYAWTVNGASEGSGSTLDYSFGSAGSYTVEVVVTDSDGHTASYSITETVYSDPSVSISSSQNPTDVGNSVTFTASPSGGSGSYTYQWYLNSNAVSGATSSTYTTSFGLSGTDSVYVIIKDGVGNSATSSTLDETVNADPSVSISSSQNPTDVGNSVTFTASGSGGTGSYSYQWYLNGSAVSGATSSTYTTSFSSAGSYSVYVVVTDSIGNTATSSTITQTVNPDPTVSISSSQNPTDIEDSVTFTADGTGGTGAFSYTWYLNGATQSSTTSAFSYSFSSSGTYTVSVTVKDTVGNTASALFTETVNADPSVSISSNQNPTDVGNSVTFTASASGGTGSYSYQWYLNGNAISGATSSTYTTSFSSAGSDSIYVTITDGIGNTATSNTITETVNADPSVSISSSQNPTDIGNSVTFTADGTGGTTPYSYAWYNDGTLESPTSSTYMASFSSSGTYTIEAITTDTNGNKAYANYSETVNVDPIVSVSSSQNPTDVGNDVTFTASGSGGTLSYAYQWYWQSNSTAISGATGYEYSTSFSPAGTYGFYVILTDINGNTAKAYINETVYSDPSVTVSEAPSPTDVNVLVEFSATPAGGSGGYTYTWTINGQTYTTQDVSLSFSASGTYTASVTTKDTVGNTATAAESIVVNHQPEVSISAQYSTVYAGTNDLFRATGAFGTGSYNYTWTNNSIVIGYGAYLTYKFGAQGTYTIEVEITDGLSQTNTSVIDITVKPEPEVSIAGPTNITYGATNYWSIVVNGSIVGGHVYWYISGINQTGDANDVQISFAYQNTTVATFPIAASYTIQDTWYNTTLNITAHNPPRVSIKAGYLTIDAGITDSFSPAVTDGSPGFTYSWTINGAVFSSEDVSYVFANPGTYTVKLTATDGDGVSASAETNVTVVSDPSVSISTPHPQYDTVYSASFSAAASGGNGSYSYQWYIDGTVVSGATSSNFVHSFSSAGSYTVYVIVKDSFGVQATSNQITVEIVNQPIVTVSASRTTADIGQPITFRSAVFNGTGPYVYEWLIGTGTASSQSSFTDIISTAGTYTVEISITDADGYSAIAKLNVTISSDPSVTATAAYPQLDTGATETFTASASGGSGSYIYSWVLAGNIISSSSSFTYIFNSVGSRTVEVSVTDSNGFTSYANVTVDVVSHPSASFTEKYSSLDVNIEDIFNSSVEYGTAPYNYTWYVNSGIVGYSSTLDYTFTSPQVAYVNLTVRDADGYSSTVSERVYVFAEPSAKIFANMTAIDQGMSVGFLSTAYNGTGPYNYTWEVDGAVTGYGTSLDYAFAASGTYTVTIIVRDSFGETGSASVSILVNKPLTVSAAATFSSIDSGQSDTFTGTVNGGTGPYFYSWSVGGSVVGSSKNLTYLFDTAGTYTLALKVIDSLGVSESYSLSITVNPSLVGSMNITYHTVDENVTDTITLTAENGTSPYTYSIFIDGSLVSSASSYARYFTAPGIYDVVAYINDSMGESVSLTSAIVVRANPSVSIVTPTNKTDANVPMQFRGILSGGTGPYSYSWLIAGHEYTDETLSYAFASAGEYVIQLTVTDAFGREAIASVNETVYADPHASLVVPAYVRASIEEPLSLNISGGIPSYSIQWYFPSGEQLSGNNVTHAFSSSGPDTIETKVTDSSGYTDTQNFTVQVHLFVAIAANQTSGLGPLAVQFSSSVLGGTDYSYNWTFGNGQYSLQQNPVYTFQPGNYSVTFKVTSANGATGEENISIHSLPPPVSFTYAPGINGTVLTTFSFNATPNWDASGPYSMSWSFPNGQDLTGMDVSYKFPVYAEFNTVIATFSYGNGQTWTQDLSVRLYPAPIQASFSIPRIVPVGAVVNLTGSAVDPDSNSLTYTWVFQNQTFNGQDQFFVFSNAGNYTVSLTVTDSLGATTTYTQKVEAEPVGNNANIVIAVQSSSNGPYTTFTIHVLSSAPLAIVEAFVGTQSFTPQLTSVDNGYWYNITLDQSGYIPGTYPLKIVVFADNGESNYAYASFFVSQTYGHGGQQFSIVSFFGGTYTFLLTILSIIIGVGTIIALRTDKKDKDTAYVNIGGAVVKAHKSPLARLGFNRAVDRGDVSYLSSPPPAPPPPFTPPKPPDLGSSFFGNNNGKFPPGGGAS